MRPIIPLQNPNALLFLILIILFSSVSLIAVNASLVYSNKIFDGVIVGNVDVSGLSVNEAKQKIEKEFKDQLKPGNIVLAYEGLSWKLPVDKVGVKINTEELAQKAFNVGRTGQFMNRVQEQYLTISHARVIPFEISYSTEQMDNFIKEIAGAVNRVPRKAFITANGDKLTIIPEIPGRSLDTRKTVEKINSLLKNQLKFTTELVVNKNNPSVTAADLQAIDGTIASYSTQFDLSDRNRSQNIALAASGINGTLLRPGEQFSFNGIVGLRLPQYGYKEAPVYIDGELGRDWGGGVCQVTTTLYNTVLLADLPIVERTSHFHPPAYVPLGQDATVADNQLDFRFKNNTANNLYVFAFVNDDEITVKILGKTQTNKPEIRIIATNKRVIEPPTVVIPDPNLDSGKQVVESQGQNGYQVTTYKVKMVNGKEVSRELLGNDDYQPSNRIVRVGTRVRLR